MRVTVIAERYLFNREMTDRTVAKLSHDFCDSVFQSLNPIRTLLFAVVFAPVPFKWGRPLLFFTSTPPYP